MSTIYKAHWREYLKFGLIPLPANGKDPVVKWKEYQEDPPCTDEYLEWQDQHGEKNIWVLLGNERAVIEPECIQAENFIQSLNLPEGPVSISGRGLNHRWFKTSSRLKAIKLTENGHDETWLELRTGPIGMIVPPSIHPDTQKAYRWREGHSLSEISLPELPIEIYDKIRALLPKQDTKPEPRMMPAQGEDNSLGPLDVERYLSRHGVKYRVKQDTDRTFFLLERCLFADQHTTSDTPGDSSIIQGANGKLGYQCFHSHCAFRTWADARRAISGENPIIQFCSGYVASPAALTHKRGEGRSLTDILNEPETEEKYLVKPILSSGDKGFVVSSYKIGKTLLLIQLTLSLSMALPFLGFEIPRAVKVLYIRFELKNHRFRKRLLSMVKGLGGIAGIKIEPIFELVRGFNLLDKKDFEWLLGLIERHKPEVLMIDPLYKIASIDLKDTANAMPLIRRFDSIIEAYPDLLIITAHHLRKQTGDEKETWDSTYGPMFFFADMDFEIRLKAKHRENPEFTFDYISNDVPVEPFTFKRNPESLLYYVSNSETDHFDEIIDYAEQNKPTKGTLKEWLISSFGQSRRQAENVIDRIVKSGQLAYEGNGKRGKIVVPQGAGFKPVPLV